MGDLATARRGAQKKLVVPEKGLIMEGLQMLAGQIARSRLRKVFGWLSKSTEDDEAQGVLRATGRNEGGGRGTSTECRGEIGICKI